MRSFAFSSETLDPDLFLKILAPCWSVGIGAVSKAINAYFVVSLALPLVSFVVPICQNFMAFNHQGHQGMHKGQKGNFGTAPMGMRKA
jgi:hypothetical protein